jgi:hypothetical protein
MKFAKLGAEKTGAKLKRIPTKDDTRGKFTTRSSLQGFHTLQIGGTGRFT